MTPPAAPLRVGCRGPIAAGQVALDYAHCFIIFNTWAYVATSFHRHFDGGSTKLVWVLD